MDEDVRKFVGHAWLDEHNDTYFVVELDVADLKEKLSRFTTIMEKEKDIGGIITVASDPTEISQESAEKALGLVGDHWETGQLVEYKGEDLEEEENHYLRYGRIHFLDTWGLSSATPPKPLRVEYICYPKYWGDVDATVELTLE